MTNPSLAYQVLLGLHFIGLALGLGSATVTDFSFFRNLRLGDRISPETVTWMRSFSTLIWVGIGVLTLSGAGMFLLDPPKYIHSTGFIVKMIFVLVLIINGLFLNFYSTARLTTFNFSQKYQMRDAAWKARKLSFVFGAISATTWYLTLFLAMLKNYIHVGMPIYLGVYAVMIGGAIMGSLTLEHLIFTQAKLHHNPKDVLNVSISQLSSISSTTYKEHLALAQGAAAPSAQPAPAAQTPADEASRTLPVQPV